MDTTTSKAPRVEPSSTEYSLSHQPHVNYIHTSTNNHSPLPPTTVSKHHIASEKTNTYANPTRDEDPTHPQYSIITMDTPSRASDRDSIHKPNNSVQPYTYSPHRQEITISLLKTNPEHNSTKDTNPKK